MLQLEGAKRWRLHSCPKGPLPRDYCWDYSEQELGGFCGGLGWGGKVSQVGRWFWVPISEVSE